MKPQILQDLMKDVNGATFLALDTETSVTLLGGKANLLQGRVTKKVTGSNVMVFQNKSSNAYENMVNRRLEKEGKTNTFNVGPRQWGSRIPNTPFVEHKGKTYLEVIFLKAGAVQYCVDGKPFNGGIEGLATDKQEGDQGGVDDKVIIRTFAADSIKAITVNHTRVEDKS